MNIKEDKQMKKERNKQVIRRTNKNKSKNKEDLLRS